MSMCASNDAAQRFLNSVSKTKGVNLWELFPTQDAGIGLGLGLDLLGKMLAFDPRERLSAAEALRHPYFAGLHVEDEREEPVFRGARFSGAPFVALDTEDFRRLIFQEITSYHPELA